MSCLTPCVNIPASPFMQKLGFGTRVNVYLKKRSPRVLSHSPWAVKKINPRCNDDYQSMYQKRLTDEAKILKSLNHPNIIGKFTYYLITVSGIVSCLSEMVYIIS